MVCIIGGVAVISLYAGISFEKHQYFVSEDDGFVKVCANLYGRQGLTVAVRFNTGSGTAQGTFISNGNCSPGTGSATGKAGSLNLQINASGLPKNLSVLKAWVKHYLMKVI